MWLKMPALTVEEKIHTHTHTKQNKNGLWLLGPWNNKGIIVMYIILNAINPKGNQSWILDWLDLGLTDQTRQF